MRINIFRICSIISFVAAAMALQSMCAKTQDSLKHHSKADSILSLELERVPSITLNDSVSYTHLTLPTICSV